MNDSKLSFSLLLQHPAPAARVKHHFSVVIGVSVAAFFLLFFVFSLMGGPMAALFYTPITWIAVGLLLLLIALPSGPGSSDKKELVLDERGIRAGFVPFRETVEWKDIQGVLLRHGVLTITFRDDCSCQYPVAPVSFEPGELELFSATCMLRARQQIRAKQPVPDAHL